MMPRWHGKVMKTLPQAGEGQLFLEAITMPVKYIISKLEHIRSGYAIHAEYADGTLELLAYFLYRVGARRMGAELQRLAPAVTLVDQTLTKKEVANGKR